MSVQVQELKRTFRYNNRPLDDPDSKMTPEEVKTFYSHLYPELTQAIIEGPEYEKEKMVYTFTRSVGTKGGRPGLRITRPLSLKALSENGFSDHLEEQSKERKEEKCLTLQECANLLRVFNSGGEPILPKSSALFLLP